ncbi:aspartyl protease family protein [Shimia aestuarii]|uniref:Aspartyl protease family protein n=2 Tax=Shimia aestuarii TaxID=254406 RepID=A0A1I4NLQ4_9RHOB|nr:aspartyl protease family protein [Shimia aestuarii]
MLLMSNIEIGNLAYLVLLTAAVGFWFFVSNRNSLGKTLQQAVIWGLIILGMIAVVGLWDDIRSTVRPTQAVFSDAGRIEIPRGQDGHYRLTLEVNNTPVTFIVDTGASDIVLSKQDARRVGFNPDDLPYYGRAMTANGEVRTAPVRLESVSLDGIQDRNIAARINGGELQQSLLGMSYLQRYEQITIAGNRMILIR